MSFAFASIPIFAAVVTLAITVGLSQLIESASEECRRRRTILEFTHEVSAVAANSAAAPESFVQRIWRPAIIGVGFGLSVVWTGVLAYGFVALILMAI